MGKLIDRLQIQLQTEYKKDAEDCLQIYNHLKEKTGNVWESQWNILVRTIFKGSSNNRRFEPTVIGRVFLKGLKKEQLIEQSNVMYSEKEVYDILSKTVNKLSLHFSENLKNQIINELFEQFKK